MEIECEDLVSVIIPVYNVETFVRRCVNSVQKQRYRNLEIIIVDDGSTDESGTICEEMAEIDKRLIVIHKSNGGLSSARNAGIVVAHGKYIAFVDSDDFIHEEYISRMYKIAVRTEADIVVCGYKKGRKDKFNKRKTKTSYRVWLSEEMLDNWHGGYKHIETMAWNKLYKKALFLNNNISYPIGYYHEDIQTTHLLVGAADKIAVTKEVLYFYYKRNSSITATLSEKRILDSIQSQNIRLQYFKEHGYRDAYERLNITKQKYYMFYFCIINDKDIKDMKKMLLQRFNENNREVMGYMQTKWKEKICFYIFKRCHKTINWFWNRLNNVCSSSH